MPAFLYRLLACALPLHCRHPASGWRSPYAIVSAFSDPFHTTINANDSYPECRIAIFCFKPRPAMPLPALQGTRQPLFCFFVLATEMATNVFSSLFVRRLLALGVQGACLVMAQQASAVSADEQAQSAAQKAAQKAAPKTAGAAADAQREAPSLPAVQVSASAELEPGAAARVQGARWSRRAAWPM